MCEIEPFHNDENNKRRKLDPFTFFVNRFIDFKTISLKRDIILANTDKIYCEKDLSQPFYNDSDILKFIEFLNKKIRIEIKKYTVDEYEKINNKCILLSYSGGRDSTYLLLKNLEDGYNVEVQYNVFNPSVDKFRILNEFIFLWNILHIAKRYPNRILLNYRNVTDMCCVNMILSQQPFNVYSLVSGMRDNVEIKECQMGLISGDCGISFIDELKSLYRSGAKFSHYYRKYNKIPPLKFPLMKMDKLNIIFELEKRVFENSIILNTCSSPTITNFKIEKNYIEFTISECGYCDTCEHLKLSLRKLKPQYNRTIIRFNYKNIKKPTKLPNPTDKLEVTESICDEKIEY